TGRRRQTVRKRAGYDARPPPTQPEVSQVRRLINLQPNRALRIVLVVIPFLLLLLAYKVGSDARKTENEQDKLLPSFTEMVNGINQMAFAPNKRTGDYEFWEDTGSSLHRLWIGVGIAASVGWLVGLAAGAIARVAAPLSPLITTI